MKQLQKRFIVLAMAAFTAIMLVLVVGINVTNLLQMSADQSQTLQRLAEYDQISAMQPEGQFRPDSGVPFVDEQEPNREFTTRFFSVHCDDSGRIDVFNNDYISSVDEQTAVEYTTAVLERGKETGRYKDYRYLVEDNGAYRSVIFLNIADSLDARRTLLFASVLIGVFSMAAALILILLLSRPAIQPFVDNMERQRRFITDAGHELKTPITSIATSADILAMEDEDNEWVVNIQNQTKRLGRLVGDLIALARLDEDKPQLEKTTFSLSEAAWEVAESAEAQARALGKVLAWDIQEGVMVDGERRSLQQMLSVLVDNAVKYADEGGTIDIRLRQERGHATIEVSNPCDLEALGDTARLFDRFYRPDEARSAQTGGSGIGLSIARSVAEAHGGHISVETMPPRTITFRVSL